MLFFYLRLHTIRPTKFYHTNVRRKFYRITRSFGVTTHYEPLDANVAKTY